MSVKERLITYLESINVSKSEFSESIGVSRAYIGSIRQSISPDKLKSIALQYPNLNIEWLITGDGSMLNSDSKLIGSVSKDYDITNRLLDQNDKLISQNQELINQQSKLISIIDSQMDVIKKNNAFLPDNAQEEDNVGCADASSW